MLIDFLFNMFDMMFYVFLNVFSGSASIYDLYAVVNYFGGMGGGYYIVYMRYVEEGMWYLYDDSCCIVVDVGVVLNNSVVYVLFYKRRDVSMR